MQRIALAVMIAPIALITLGAPVWLWPSGVAAPEQPGAAEQLTGQVIAVHREQCPEPLPDDVNGCGTADVRVAVASEGELEVEAPLPNGPGAPEIAEGDEVVLIHSETPDGETYSIVDHQRGTELWVLAVAFALAVIAFGRWRGVSALAGLAVTFTLLLLFVVPAILAGEQPLLVAIVGSAAIVLTVLYLTHGFHLSTTVALLGTLASLSLTGAVRRRGRR